MLPPAGKKRRIYPYAGLVDKSKFGSIKELSRQEQHIHVACFERFGGYGGNSGYGGGGGYGGSYSSTYQGGDLAFLDSSCRGTSIKSMKG